MNRSHHSYQRNTAKEKTGNYLGTKSAPLPIAYYLAVNSDKGHQETYVLN
jgi:hypothetical protein